MFHLVFFLAFQLYVRQISKTESGTNSPQRLSWETNSLVWWVIKRRLKVNESVGVSVSWKWKKTAGNPCLKDDVANKFSLVFVQCFPSTAHDQSRGLFWYIFHIFVWNCFEKVWPSDLKFERYFMRVKEMSSSWWREFQEFRQTSRAFFYKIKVQDIFENWRVTNLL